jgi:hypothetical protein
VHFVLKQLRKDEALCGTPFGAALHESQANKDCSSRQQRTRRTHLVRCETARAAPPCGCTHPGTSAGAAAR